jgi:hypothetical protein
MLGAEQQLEQITAQAVCCEPAARPEMEAKTVTACCAG